MSATQIQAVYRDTGVEAYRGNPFIEALCSGQPKVDTLFLQFSYSTGLTSPLAV